MRVVRPDHDLAPAEPAIQMGPKCVQSFRHVAIPQIPSIHSAPKHGPVIFFCIADESGILLGGEELVLGDVSIPMQVFIGAALQINELLDHLPLAGLRHTETRGIAVRLFVLAEVIEAGVTCARSLGRCRVDSFQIMNHLSPGAVQAIQVEAVETGWMRCTGPLVVLAEPTDELRYHLVAPHPGGEAAEAAQSLFCLLIFASAAHILIYAIRIRPIGLDRDGVKAFLLNEALGDFRAALVELLGPMRRFANENQVCISDPL